MREWLSVLRPLLAGEKVDFEGTSINLTDTPPDQLRLDDTTGAFEFIWIAASNRGTVIKIDRVAPYPTLFCSKALLYA